MREIKVQLPKDGIVRLPTDKVRLPSHVALKSKLLGGDVAITVPAESDNNRSVVCIHSVKESLLESP